MNFIVVCIYTLLTCMNDSNSCFGCQKPFPTQKRLHAHEIKCWAHGKWKADLSHVPKCLKRMAQTDDMEDLRSWPQFGADRISPNHDQSPQAMSGFYDDTVDPDNNLVHIFCISSPSYKYSNVYRLKAKQGHLALLLNPLFPCLQVEHQHHLLQCPLSALDVLSTYQQEDYLPTGGGLQHILSPPSSTHSSCQALPASADLSVGDQDPRWLIKCRTLPNEMGLFQLYPTHLYSEEWC